MQFVSAVLDRSLLCFDHACGIIRVCARPNPISTIVFFSSKDIDTLYFIEVLSAFFTCGKLPESRCALYN